MNNANLLRTVNLNLLPVLQALLREQSLVGASRALALSQPAVHSALGQLRIVLGDPLLVRVGRRMVLTARALALVEPVERACDAMRRVIELPAFDAAGSQRSFLVAGSDYEPVLIGPPLMNALSRQAPGVSVQFLNIGKDAFERLRQGDIDLVIAPRPVLESIDWPVAQTLDLWQERFVHVVRTDHPLAGTPAPSPAQIAAYPQLGFEPGWYPESGPRAEFEVADLHPDLAADSPVRHRLVLRVEQFCTLPLLLVQSDAVALLPAQLLKLLDSHMKLKVLAEPCPPFDVALAWGAVDDDDPAHRWFRSLVAAAA